MKSLQECKEHIAKMHGYIDWSELFQEGIFVMTYMDEAAELYAKSQVEARDKEIERLKAIDKVSDEYIEMLHNMLAHVKEPKHFNQLQKALNEIEARYTTLKQQ